VIEPFQGCSNEEVDVSKPIRETYGLSLQDRMVTFQRVCDSIHVMLAQISPTFSVDVLRAESLVKVKDPDKQAQKILRTIEHFHAQNADLLLFPELVAPVSHLPIFEEALRKTERDLIANICYEHTLVSELIPLLSEQEIELHGLASPSVEGRFVNFCRIMVKAGSRADVFTQIKLTPFSSEFSLSAKDSLFCGKVLYRFITDWGNFIFLICKDYVGEVGDTSRIPMFDFLKLLTDEGLHYILVSSLNPEPEAFVHAARAFYYLQEKSSNTFTVLLNTAELDRTTVVFPIRPHPKIRATKGIEIEPLFDEKPGWGTQVHFPGCEEKVITGRFVRLDTYQPSPIKGMFSPVYQVDLLSLSSLGIEPEAVIREETEPIHPRHLHNFPVQPTPFLGREEELAEIGKLLEDPSCRLLSLVGLGGIGKTRVALQAAAQQIGAFRDGIYFVPLSSVSSLEFLIPTIADYLKFSFYGREDPKVQLLNYLREKELLLVIDNFEHLLDGAGLLAEILENAPGVKLFITSRQRLNLQGEWILEIGGMQVPESEEIDRLEDYSAVQLFLQDARKVRSGFTLSEEKPSVVRICQLVGGMPLGIELASVWVKVLSCSEIAREIEENQDFLATTLRDAPERHRSLRAVFEHSWNLLSKEEKGALTNLCIFRGGFSREAADEVAGASLLLLSALVDRSLLRRNPSGRYEMHGVIRQYAEEKLKEDPQGEARVRDLHGEYYADFLQQREAHLRGRRQHKVLQEVAEEIENVRDAWGKAIEKGEVVQIAKFVDGLYLFYEIRSWYQEGERVFGMAVDRLRGKRGGDEPTGDRISVLGKVLARQGDFQDHLRLYERASETLQESLSISRNLDIPSETAFSLNCLGNVALGMGEYAEAQRLYQESLAIYREIGDRSRIERVLNNLGNVATRLGAYPEAQRLYQESLAICREIGDRYSTEVVLNNLGNVSSSMGMYAEAQRFYQETLAICREIDNRYAIQVVLNNLGSIATRLGNYEQAKQLLQESIAICREIGSQYGIARSFNNLGDVAEKLGDYGEAQRLYQESLMLCKEVGARRLMVLALINLGNVACTLGDYRESKQHLDEALGAAMDIRAVPLALKALMGMAILLIKGGKEARALELLAHILYNPASEKHTQERAERLFTEHEPRVPPHVIDAAKEKGKAEKLDIFIRQVLNEGVTL
jgi:predicted ATPase/Tfp pilus assembly protein PilF/predicted amidohydrolase